jgi:predicted RNA-binding protein with PIN domain
MGGALIMSTPELEQRVNKLELKVKTLEKLLKKSNQSNLSKLKEELDKPVERTPEDIEEAMSIVGIFDGPKDLARHFRSYLYGEKK